MKFILIVLLTFSTSQAFSADKPEQCILVRDNYARYDVEVPAKLEILLDETFQLYEVPKKLLPQKFRIIKITNNEAHLQLRVSENKGVSHLYVSTKNYMQEKRSQSAIYYGSLVLPEIRLKSQDQGFIQIDGNQLKIDNGNLEIHVSPCENLFLFSPKAEILRDGTPELVEETNCGYGGC